MKRIVSFILCTCVCISMLTSGCAKEKDEDTRKDVTVPDMKAFVEAIVDSTQQNTKPDSTEPKETQPAPQQETTPPEAQPSEPQIEVTTPPETSPEETSPNVTDPEDTETPTQPEETAPPPTLPPATEQDDIQSFIDGICQKYGAVGIQVAIVDNGKIVGTYGSGWATMNSDPMTADHKLRVASLSKIVIGIMAMQLREQGTLTMDSDIGPIWGLTARSPYYPDTPITIDYLLTHTSTISDYGNQADMDYASVRSRLDHGFTGAVPGSINSYYYNNYAFRLLGMTLELAAGQTMDQYLKNGLFAQMGIDAAFASGDIRDTGKLATLYWEGNGVARSLSYQMDIHGPSSPGGDGFHYSGGLTISATDMAKILVLLANDGQYNGQQLLSGESVAFMENYIPTRMYDGTYQARPMVYTPNIYGRDGIYFHTGSGWGVYNCFSYDPITKDGVIVLTNGASSGGTNSCGIYRICSEINEYCYDLTK